MRDRSLAMICVTAIVAILILKNHCDAAMVVGAFGFLITWIFL